MRGILVAAVILGCLPVIPFQPFFGMMVWQWFSTMSPQGLVYGSLRALPYGYAIGILTLVALLFSRERKLPPFDSTTILILLLLGWTVVTTFNTLIPFDVSFARLVEFAKAVALSLATYALLTTRKRLQTVIWVVTCSIALLALKGAVWVLLTGGGNRVYGPDGSSIGDNNDFGVVLLMFLPLLFYLHETTATRRSKQAVKVLIGGMLIAIVFTYSRGAVVGLACVSTIFWWRSKRKFITAAAFLLAVGVGMMVVPAKWFHRVDTIDTYQEDPSAMGRILFWRISIAIGEDRLFGGGFRVWDYPAVINRFAVAAELPTIHEVRAAHSIYFGPLSEHGVPGLLLFLGLMLVAWRNANALRRLGKPGGDLRWAETLGRMSQVALIGFWTAGAFVPLSYYDGYYTLLVIIAAARRLAVAETEPEAAATLGNLALPLQPAPAPARFSP